jgi:hypothetical protein
MIIVVKLVRRGGRCGQIEDHTGLVVATQTDFGETVKLSYIVTCHIPNIKQKRQLLDLIIQL